MILGNEGCCAEGKGERVVVKFVTWSVVVARELGFMVHVVYRYETVLYRERGKCGVSRGRVSFGRVFKLRAGANKHG